MPFDIIFGWDKLSCTTEALMRVILIGLAMFVTLADGRADEATLKKAATAKVDEMIKALVAGDFAKIADVRHPKVIEMNGGREKLLAVMEGGMKAAKEQGIEFVAATSGAATAPVKAGADTYIIVPFKLEMKAPVGKLTQNTFVIGVSADDGKTWKFINGDLDRKVVRDILPHLPQELKIPDREMPKIEKP